MVSELSEQIFVVRSLRAARILFCHVPNGGRRDKREAYRLRASGVVAGVPDLLIFDPPSNEFVGVALELKREGCKPSSVTKKQREWLSKLEARGWASVVGFGAADALKQLRDLGYDV